MQHYAVVVNGRVIGARSSQSHAVQIYTHAVIVTPGRTADYGVISYHRSESLARDAQRTWAPRFAPATVSVVPVAITPRRAQVGDVVRVSDECPACSRIGAGPLCKSHRPAPGVL